MKHNGEGFPTPLFRNGPHACQIVRRQSPPRCYLCDWSVKKETRKKRAGEPCTISLCLPMSSGDVARRRGKAWDFGGQLLTSHEKFRRRVLERPVPRQQRALLMSRGPKKVRSEPGSDRFGPILDILNTEPDLRSGSAISLNLDPNLGPVRTGSGSNRGSEPNHGITNNLDIIQTPLQEWLIWLIVYNFS